MRILVFDLGGGTLDVTVMEFGEGVFEVKSTSGDTQLGGTDMDTVLVDFIAEDFKKKEGVDLSKDAQTPFGSVHHPHCPPAHEQYRDPPGLAGESHPTGPATAESGQDIHPAVR